MSRKSIFTILTLSVLLLSLTSIHALGCLDQSQVEEPWWVAIRLPGKSPRTMIKYDAPSQSWVPTLGDDNGEVFLKRLLAQVDPSTDYYMAFNDEHPKLNGGAISLGSGTAHAKGLMVVDKNWTGFYLHHSVPKYPAFSPQAGFDYTTPPTSHYGQHFMCLTIKTKATADLLRTQFKLENVSIYADNFPTTTDSPTTDAGLTTPRLLTKTLKLQSQQVSIVDLTNDWKMFTKPPSDLILLWDDSVTPYYKDSLLTETWGRPYSADVCDKSGDEVSNIHHLKVSIPAGVHEWRDTLDHSKWGLFLNINVICVGDMNRMDSQAKRGGSAFCREDAGLYQAFKGMIENDGCGLVAPDV
jgi:deoxyribonuclease-2